MVNYNNEVTFQNMLNVTIKDSAILEGKTKEIASTGNGMIYVKTGGNYARTLLVYQPLKINSLLISTEISMRKSLRCSTNSLCPVYGFFSVI